MISRVWICLFTISWIVLSTTGANLSVSEIQETGKILFRELRDSECKVRCKSRKPRIMCGSDGVSYQSKCELKRARRCEGKKISIRKKGKCSEEDVPMTKCFQEKEEALEIIGRTGAVNNFVPECNADGTFAEVQCHKPSQYCWCVSPSDGKPLKNTSTNNGKPKCKGKKSKSSNNKRGSRKTRKSSNKNSKKCTKQEKRKFNENLVKVFTEEYNRSVKTQVNTESDDPLDTLESRVVDWKFSQCDKNGDNQLTIKEVDSLRRLVKKYIKPKLCAKRFLKFCDPDKNKLIEKREWTKCLGVDLNNEEEKRKPATEVNPSGESLDLNKLLKKDPPTSPVSSEPTKGKIERPSFPTLPINMDNSWPGAPKPRLESKPRVDKQPDDCLRDRQIALEQEADNPDAGIFIPKCTAEGKWTRAQCHKSTGYCWCVEENSGRPISGTSTQGVDPKCDFEAEREIEGCNYAEKQAFIADLLNVFKKELTEYALNNSTDHSTLVIDPNQSLPERAVRWRFNTLDNDSNQLLESAEVEVFRKTSLKDAQKKHTRKCARKFVRYCDEDGNKKINEQEWVDCMGVNRNGNINLPSNPKRIGKNPFDEYLRDT